MKIKKHTNSAWTDLDKPVKKFGAYTDTATALPLTIEASATDAIENYQVYGASGGVGEQTENIVDFENQQQTIPTWSRAYDTKITNNISQGQYTLSYKINGLIPSSFMVIILSGDNFSPTTQIIYKEGLNVNTKISITFNWTETLERYLWVRFVRLAGAPSVPLTYEVQDVMLTEGSTAPTTYIPFGYKIPILNTSGNLWNGEIEQGAINTQGYKQDDNTRVRSCITGLVSGHSYTIQSNLCIRIIYAYNGGWSGTKIRNVYDSYVQVYVCTFTLPEGADSIGISLYKHGSATTTPSDVTTAVLVDKSNYDLMIGDSKLYEDEYLDFAEQKVYKRTENDFPYAEAGVYGFSKGTATVTSDGEGRFVVNGAIPYESISAKIPLITDYNILSSVGSGGEYIYYLGNDHKDYLQVILYDENDVEISTSGYQGNSILRKIDSYTFTGTVHSVAFRNNRSGEITIYASNNKYALMFSKSNTLTDYIPYLQPTDPPAPFPTLTTYIGENSIDVDTQVQPEKVVCEYQGWKPAGDGEMKYYHNGWVNTPPPTKPSWLADGYEAVLDAKTAPSNYYCDLAYVENGIQMVYRVYVSTDTTCQIEHPDNYISVLQSPYSSSFRGFTTYGVRYNNGVWNVATTTSNQDRGQTAYASIASQRAILSSTITNLTNASGYTFEDYR